MRHEAKDMKDHCVGRVIVDYSGNMDGVEITFDDLTVLHITPTMTGAHNSNWPVLGFTLRDRRTGDMI